MLGLEAKTVNKRKIPILDLIPAFQTEKEACMHRGGTMVEVQLNSLKNEESSEEEGVKVQ